MADRVEAARKRWENAVYEYGQDSGQARLAERALTTLLREEGVNVERESEYSSIWDRVWPDNAWHLLGISGPGKKGDKYRSDLNYAYRYAGGRASLGAEGPRLSLPRDTGSAGAYTGPSDRPTGRNPRYPTATTARNAGLPADPKAAPPGTGVYTGNGANDFFQAWLQYQKKQARISAQQQAAMERAAQDDIIAFVGESFNRLGMGDMTGVITDLARQGYGAAEITLRLRQTEQYKQTFGYINDARTKSGLAALNEREIIDLRNAYRGLMRTSGMPKGFYDSQDDFDKFLINDVSVAELGQRISIAEKVVGERVDPDTQAAFKQYFGIGKKQLAAYFLDPERALPLLEKQADMARVGGEALASGVAGLAGKKFIGSLVDKGIDQGAARQAFGIVAEEADSIAALGDIEGSRVSTKNQAEAVLGLDNRAKAQVDGLKSRERARFSRTGAGTNLLGTETSGSY